VSLLVAAFALAACGSIHPGAAAVVDGDTISMRTLDRTADAMCVVQARTQQQTQPIDNAQVKRDAAVLLVLEKASAATVRDEGIAVDPKLAAVPGDAEASIRKAFGAHADDVLALVKDQQRVYAELIAIGSDSTGQTPNADILDPLARAGQQIVAARYDDLDVSFAPRLGLSKKGAATGGVGSLSVSADDLGQASPSPVVGCSA